MEWLAPRPPARVADVGAGTGLLTSGLVARGLSVEAVEPDPRMLAVLRREVPAAIAHEAASDAMPFEDGSLDAVLVAEAWHWFPVDSTIAEVRRVLKPGGWLARRRSRLTRRQPTRRDEALSAPRRAGRASPGATARPRPPG